MGALDDVWGDSNSSSSGGGALDDTWASAQPSFSDKILADVKSIPDAVENMVSAIPSGAKNLYDLPSNIFGWGQDVGNQAMHDAFGTVFTPSGTDYGQLQRTIKGIGAIDAGALGPIGSYLYDKGNQAAGNDAPTTNQQDQDTLLKNTVQQLILGGAGKAMGGTANAVSDSVANNIPEAITPEDQAVANLGVTPGQVSKAAKYKGPDALMNAVQGGMDRGIFSGEDTSPAGIQIANEGQIANLGNQLHGENGLLSKADNIIRANNPPSSDSLNEIANSDQTPTDQITNTLADNGITPGEPSPIRKVQMALSSNADAIRETPYRIQRAISDGNQQGLSSDQIQQNIDRITDYNKVMTSNNEVFQNILDKYSNQDTIPNTENFEDYQGHPNDVEYYKNDNRNLATTETKTTTPSAPITYNNALKFIASNPYQAPALMEQLQKRSAITDQMFDPEKPLSSLSQIKSALGNIAYTGLTDSKALDQAIYQDLNNTIQSQAESAVPGLGQKIGDLNSDISEHYTLRPMIQNAVNKGVASSLKIGDTAPTALDIAKSALVGGAAGGGAGLLASSLVPHVAGPLAILGAIMKTVPTALKNPTIGGAVSSGLGVLGDTASNAGVLNYATNNQPQPSQLDAIMQSIFSRSQAMPNNPVTPTPQAQSAALLDKIRADPFYGPAAMAESRFNPNAAAPAPSTAKGLFGFNDPTAKLVKLQNPYDIAQSYAAMQKLTNDNIQELSSVPGFDSTDPVQLYMAHVLGAPLAKKVLLKQPLSTAPSGNQPSEADRYAYFMHQALPNFVSSRASLASSTGSA